MSASLDDTYYIDGFNSTSDEGSEFEFSSSNQAPKSSRQRTPLATQGHSPPLVLAFPLSTSQAHNRSPCATSWDGSHSDHDQDSEHCDEPIEEWMILGGGEHDGDRDIQLNLGYWSSSSSSDWDSGDEDEEQMPKVDPNWTISAKDKGGPDQLHPNRYFTSGRNLICHNCNKTGHLVKSCPTPRKRPTCTLCGLQGHLQRGCPGRHCPSCGLPAHGYHSCPEPPIWYQHCHRCGMTGHLTDACPDTWRQYHLTTQQEIPRRPHRDKLKHRKRPAHCYNCSSRGHYGHECNMRRMISGTFPSLPYVCHYDDLQDILRQDARIQKKARELGRVGLTPEPQRTSEATGGSEEEYPAPKRKSLEARREGGRRKTWPERRRERREVKRLRREAQARREGGLGSTGRGRDEEGITRDPFRSRHRDPTPPPPQKKRRRSSHENGGRSQERGRRSKSRDKSRKSREAERWKKRGGMKRGDLHPRDDLGPVDESLLSPKHRVRHRRR